MDEQTTGTGKIFVLPLRPKTEAEKTDAEKTSHPVLPFAREYELEKDVIEMLSNPTFYYHLDTQPAFGMVPAIKYAKNVKDCDLRTAKDYVENILEKHLDKIKAARVKWQSEWLVQHSEGRDERV